MATLYTNAGMSTATTGTGTVTLGIALSGNQSFANAGVPDAATVPYRIEEGANWEIGEGTYTASGTTLSRDTVSFSSNGGSKITLAGAAQVFVTARATDLTGIPAVVNDATPQLGGQLDVNGQAIGDGTRELLTFVEDGSAVNHVEIENEATGSGPVIRAAGDDTNVDLNFTAKGSGAVNVNGNRALTTGDEGAGNGLDADTVDGIQGGSLVRADADDALTGGYTSTADGDGTKSSGTYTPDPAGGNLKTATNGGAHTLASPMASGDYTLIIQYTNNGSAGTITTSGFTKETGDSFTTTDGHDFICYITKVNGFTHLHVTALQ